MDSYGYPYQDYNSYGHYSTSTQSMSSADSAVVVASMLLMSLVALICCAIIVIGRWRLFTKAGRPGWAALIPVYGDIVALRIAGRPDWWVLFAYAAPLFGFWVYFVAMIDLVRSYQRSGWWVAGLTFVPVIAYPWLAFSSRTQYRGPIAAASEEYFPAAVPERSEIYDTVESEEAVEVVETPTKTRESQPLPPKKK